MKIDWKWFLIGLVIGLLVGCSGEPYEGCNYTIWDGTYCEVK